VRLRFHVRRIDLSGANGPGGSNGSSEWPRRGSGNGCPKHVERYSWLLRTSKHPKTRSWLVPIGRTKSWRHKRPRRLHISWNRFLSWGRKMETFANAGSFLRSRARPNIRETREMDGPHFLLRRPIPICNNDAATATRGDRNPYCFADNPAVATLPGTQAPPLGGDGFIPRKSSCGETVQIPTAKLLVCALRE
jgi:hypothetical protein